MAQQLGQPTAPDESSGLEARPSLWPASDLAAILIFALIGIGIALYLTTVHYAHVSLLCTAGGVVNCTQVTTSVYSVVPGTDVPITIPGLLWFVVSGGLALVAWRRQVRTAEIPVRLTLAQLGWGIIGMVTVLYLVFVEVVRLHAICEWCTGVHVLTLLTFLVTLYRLQKVPDVSLS